MLSSGRWQYKPKQQLNFDDELESIPIAGNEAFFERMRQYTWLYIPSAPEAGISKYNQLIPPSLTEIDSILLIMPLVSNSRLLGFMTISSKNQQAEDLDWEDLGLLRMVGKQVSNYVDFHTLASEMVITRQHPVSTFSTRVIGNEKRTVCFLAEGIWSLTLRNTDTFY